MQLANLSPVTAQIIDIALKETPSFGKEFSLEQVEAILLAPLLALAKLEAPRIVTVIIDGVDEFKQPEGSNLPHVAAVLGEVATSLPSNARLLILSRPESAILTHIPTHVKRHDLTPKESYDDVQKYFEKELKELGKRHKLDHFPSPDQLDHLCNSVAGHLGCAKQLTTWLGTRLLYRTSATLQDDIQSISHLAGGNLDELYILILKHALPPTTDPDFKSFAAQLHKILECLAALKSPEIQPIAIICGLIKPENGFDVFKCLQRLSSLYASGTEEISERTIAEPHKSFFDFVFSRAPPKFRVDLATAHHELALSCFRIMREDLHFNMGGFDSPRLHNDDAPSKVPAHVIYACCKAAYHVQGSGKAFVGEIGVWIKESFLLWLEVMSLSGKITDLRESQSEAVLKTLKANTKVIQLYFLPFTNA
jgi:hypothetical protein